jgi:hypothetical protein
MKTWKMITVAALAVVAVALITASALAYNNRFLSSFGTQQNGMMGGTTPYGYSNGYPQTSYPTQSTQPTQTTVPYYPSQYGGWGCGCMRGGTYGSSVPYYPTSVSYANPITIDQAVTIAEGYLTRLNNPDLAVSQVKEYTQNFYVSYYEKSTGIGAFQMLIDKYTGNILPEMGPNMMWNTKYGMMGGHAGGMMGGWRTTPTTPMTVSVDQAKTLTQQYLNTYYPGTTVGDVQTFYGYYNVEVLQSGTTYGMLSVNGYTGQVWYHSWHGTFIQEWESQP